MPASTTLEQWFILQTVIEQGSYAKAAELLHCSQSSISYSLSALQERLGLPLLKIVGRKAELTDSGKLMLAQAQPLLLAFSQLEMRAHNLGEGTRANITLVVDGVFPREWLFSVLKTFHAQFPQTQVHVTEILKTESDQLLAQREADLYITTLKPETTIVGDFLLAIDFIAVAHSQHPLHQQTGPLSVAQLAPYPMVFIADRILQRLEKRKISTTPTWAFSSFEAAIEAISSGVGYGWLPRYRIASKLESGELKPLPVASPQLRRTQLFMVYGQDQYCYDPTISAIASMLQEKVKSMCKDASVL